MYANSVPFGEQLGVEDLRVEETTVETTPVRRSVCWIELAWAPPGLAIKLRRLGLRKNAFDALELVGSGLAPPGTANVLSVVRFWLCRSVAENPISSHSTW